MKLRPPTYPFRKKSLLRNPRKFSHCEESPSYQPELKLVQGTKVICALDLLVQVFVQKCHAPKCQLPTVAHYTLCGPSALIKWKCPDGQSGKLCTSHKGDSDHLLANNLTWRPYCKQVISTNARNMNGWIWFYVIFLGLGFMSAWSTSQTLFDQTEFEQNRRGKFELFAWTLPPNFFRLDWTFPLPPKRQLSVLLNLFFSLTNLFLTFVVFACFATTRVNMRFRAENTRDSAQGSIQCRKYIGSPVVRTDGHTDGWSRDYYVTTKIFWLDRLPNFLSNGGPLTR